MINIREFIENHESDSETQRFFNDYAGSSGYICDAISEYADSQIDVYNYDLIEWAKTHICEIDEAVDELGKPDSFIGYIQQGQYVYYERMIYDELDKGIEYAVYKTLLDNGVEEITEEQAAEVDAFIDGLDNNNRFEDFNEVLEIVKKIKSLRRVL